MTTAQKQAFITDFKKLLADRGWVLISLELRASGKLVATVAADPIKDKDAATLPPLSPFELNVVMMA